MFCFPLTRLNQNKPLTRGTLFFFKLQKVLNVNGSVMDQPYSSHSFSLVISKLYICRGFLHTDAAYLSKFLPRSHCMPFFQINIEAIRPWRWIRQLK